MKTEMRMARDLRWDFSLVIEKVLLDLLFLRFGFELELLVLLLVFVFCSRVFVVAIDILTSEDDKLLGLGLEP